MSEPKLVSPLLDQFVMGAPISQHHGVRCCPAMQNDSDNKYIVKIISIPASQRSVDALLLAGAFSGPQAARDYFRELADGVVAEAQTLQQLSKLEGFVPYSSWQVEPMDPDIGYDIYLLSDYRRSLDRRFRREAMTHLAAVNLGLDLCAALAVCRRCGYLYVNLKPENVFIGEDQNYRIGDLGFIALDKLQHASLPDRYRSAYTPPEIPDAYSSLNTTMDIYAVGLILYQAYNNGQLPFGETAPGEPLPPPMYADYEMAEIILKACDPNPENRWEDPLKMGKALVSYMQRNAVNDVPIVPAPPAQEPAAAPEALLEELPDDDYLAQDLLAAGAASADAALSQEAEATQADEAAAAEDLSDILTEEVEKILAEEAAAAGPGDPEAGEAEAAEGILPVLTEEVTAEAEETVDAIAPATVEEAAAEEAEAAAEAEETVDAIAPATVEEAEENDQTQETESVDETLPSEENVVGLEQAPLTEDVSAMLALADELIAHELPEPVVAPEPIPLTVPEPLPVQEPVPEEPAEAPAPEASEEPPVLPTGSMLSEEPEADPQQEEEEGPRPSPFRTRTTRSFKGLIIFLLVVALGLALFTGAYAYYQFHYLQNVSDISLNSEDGYVRVVLTTDVDNSLLTVVCKDTYGNTQRRPVSNNVAVFDNLNPGTSYDFFLEISGFHSLTGKVKASMTTAQQTTILNLSVVTGSEDGSAIVSFNAQGPDSSWQVVCTAEGESAKTFSCINHTANLLGLTPGVTYNIQLVPSATLYMVGQTSITHTASKVIYAQDVKAASFRDNKLTVSWSAPADATVDNWTVRCYNNGDVDKTVTVSGTEAVFEGLDPSKAYNIEIIAEGMTRSVTAYISPNIVQVYDLKVATLDQNSLGVTWSYYGNNPEGGWRLLYFIDGGKDPMVVNCSGTSATLPLIPGSRYTISVHQATGDVVLDGTTSYTTAEAEKFAGYWINADSLNFYISLPTEPPFTTWDNVTLPETFAPGSKASLLMHTRDIYQNGFEEIVNLYVIRDSSGAVVSFINPVRLWTDMLEGGIGISHLQTLPTTAGKYTLQIYFNSAFAGEVSFTVAPN